jgi:hypothetical protein
MYKMNASLRQYIWAIVCLGTSVCKSVRGVLWRGRLTAKVTPFPVKGHTEGRGNNMVLRAVRLRCIEMRCKDPYVVNKWRTPTARKRAEWTPPLSQLGPR